MNLLKAIILSIIFTCFTSCDESGENLFISPSTPYLGILHTSENDPAPLGGDGTDWFDLPQAGVYIYPAYPNPTIAQVILGFATNETRKGKIYLHDQITNQIKIIADQEFLAGRYEIRVDLNELKFQKGIIRAYIMFGGNVSWGDIFYN